MPKRAFHPDTLGKRIATARRMLGVREGKDILPPQLAQLLGVSQASVYNWEADDSVPREDALLKLCAVLSVTPQWLRYGITETSVTVDLHEEQGDTVGRVAVPVRRRKNGG